MATRREFLSVSAGLGALLAARREAGAALDRLAEERVELGPPLRGAYDLNPGVVYLNHASIGTTPRAVRAAQSRLLGLTETNPWLHVWGGALEEQAERARGAAAEFIGAATDELAIMRTTTEAMHLLASGLPFERGDEVLFSSLNHIGAGACFRRWGESRGYSVREFDFPTLDAPGLTPEDVVRLHIEQIRDETRLLVLPYADNMIGMLHPVRAIARAARERGVEWIAVDAAQTVGMLPVDVEALGVDYLACSAHKWAQSPKVFGLLHMRREHIGRVRPMFVTWGQAQWRGSARMYEDYGTRDLASIIAMGDAFDFQRSLGIERTAEHRMRLRARVRERVDATPGLVWRSPREASLASAVALVGLEGRDADNAAETLFGEHGVVCRPFSGRGLNALRLSFNAANGDDDLDAVWRGLGL